MTHLLVDAMNVIGSRPDGWWRDRAGAVDRLVAEVAAARDRLPATRVTVVADGRGVDLDGDVGLRWAGVGRDAADDLVVTLVEADGGQRPTVVTADRGLRARVAALGAEVRGPSWLRSRLVARDDASGQPPGAPDRPTA